MLVVLLAAAGAVNAGWNPAIEWLERAPQTFRKIDQRVRPLRAVIARFDEITEWAGRLAQGVAQSTKIAASPAANEPGTALAMTKSALKALTVIPLALLFLIGGPPLFARMDASLSGSETSASALRLTQAIRVEVSRYFATITLINLGLGRGIRSFALSPSAVSRQVAVRGLGDTIRRDEAFASREGSAAGTATSKSAGESARRGRTSI